MKIIKRSGEKAAFDQEKITFAISKAKDILTNQSIVWSFTSGS